MGFFDDIFDFIGDIFEGIAKVIGKVISGVVSAFTSPFGAKIDVPDYGIGANQDEAMAGVLLTKDSAVSEIPIVYGERQVGGTRIFVSTNGTDNKYLYTAIVLSEGTVNSFVKLFIDENEVPLTSYSHGVQATPSSGNYANKLVCQFFDGRDDQISSTLLQEAPGWTSDHRLRGLAYLALRFEWVGFNTTEAPNNNPYSGNLPTVRAQIQGKKIYDITGGYAPAAIGSITSYTPSTYFASPTDTNTSIVQNINVASGSTSFSYPALSTDFVDVFFTLNSTADVTISMNADLTLQTPLQFDGQVIVRGRSATIGRDVGGGTYTTVSSLSMPQFYVDAGRNADGLSPTQTRHQERYLSLNLTAGSYRVRLNQHKTTTYQNQTYTANFKNTIKLIVPERTAEHTTAYESEVVTYNKNPVNVLLDYLRSSRYGKGIDNDSINWLSFYKSALQCDQTVTYADASTSKAFTCDAVIDTANTIMSNCKIILAGMRGIMPYQQGKYTLLIENGGDNDDFTATPSEVNTIFTVTNDQILGGINLEGETKENKCNRCIVTYVDPSADYQPNEVVYPLEGSADDVTYLAEDDNLRLEKKVTLPTIANRKIAEQYAQVFVKRSRNQKFISFNTNLSLSNVGVGDLIRVINDFIGLDGIFRISDLKISPEGVIEINGIEHQSSAYAIAASGSDYTRPTLNLPNPLFVPEVTNLVLNSGSAYDQINNINAYVEEDSITKRIYASWNDSNTFRVRYIVQYKQSTDSDFITAGTTVVREFYIPGVRTGVNYDVRVAAENELGRRSSFTTASNHTVVD